MSPAAQTLYEQGLRLALKEQALLLDQRHALHDRTVA